MSDQAVLEVQNLNTCYGKSHVLDNVGLRIHAGELVTLLGRNGAGKSTCLKSLAGAVRPASGSIRFHQHEIAGLESYEIAQRGLCLVPEQRGIFSLLTVEENLTVAARKSSPWQLADVYRLFPRLKERRRNGGAQLSGGEQQMLAIARALMNHPTLLMLDEPVEGLAPVIVDELVAQLKTIRGTGMPILLVEQNLQVCHELADRHYIIEQGRIVYEADNATFAHDQHAKDRHLGVNVAAAH